MNVSAPAGVWRLTIDTPDVAAAEVAANALATECPAVSAFEDEDGRWRVEGLSRDEPNLALIEAALALGLSGTPPLIAREKMPGRDWLAENQASFPPLSVGRFFVHGSHHRGAVPRSSIPILIDAATAFGTGEHATTRGCLRALEMVTRRPARPKHSLDMGCGTGILAIAAAKRSHRPVLACDIDNEAVRVTRVNAARNGVTALIRTESAAGYRHREIARRAPFDLIFANILARPLIDMAGDLARSLAPGGVAILSGLLARQENAVMAAHRAQGLALRARIKIEGWHTLIVARRAQGEWG